MFIRRMKVHQPAGPGKWEWHATCTAMVDGKPCLGDIAASGFITGAPIKGEAICPKCGTVYSYELEETAEPEPPAPYEPRRELK